MIRHPLLAPWRLALCCTGALPLLVSAQVELKPFRADDGTPVLRAEPVRPLRPLPADPVQRPAPAASEDLPVATPIPRATPAKGRSARAKATPVPQKDAAGSASTPAAPPPMPEPEDPGSIRISPQGPTRSPDQAQLVVADSYWNRGLFREAAPEYQRYVELYPSAPDVGAATFRLAECYRKTGSLNQARATYDSLLARYQVGDFVGPAAYFLADLYYQDKDYTTALPYYRKAAQRLKEPPVINAAKFFAARCLEALGGAGNKYEATQFYRDLSDTKTENPFADASRLSLALLLKESGRLTEALRQIQAVAKQTSNDNLRVEATVRSGLWALEAEQIPRAQEDLQKALAMPNIGAWKEVAQLGLLRVFYDAGKYDQVLQTAKEAGDDFSKENRAELLLLTANAYRQKNQSDQALSFYNRLLKESNDSPYAKEAAYQRLVLLYNAGDPALGSEINAFLANQPDPRKRDQVQLMQAEFYYKKGDFAAALPLYQQAVDSTQLPGPLRAEAMVKLGYCAMETQAFDQAIKTYTQFLDTYPSNKLTCGARVQRGKAYQNSKRYTDAEKDYQEVIRRYPKCPEREYAIHQEAKIRGRFMNDSAGMAQNFELLLKDYPQSLAAPEANYWLGRNAYESKNYPRAIKYVLAARELKNDEYFEQATQLLMRAYYLLEDQAGVIREVDLYQKSGKDKVPREVLSWLADDLFDKQNWASAEKYFTLLTDRGDGSPRDLLNLGQTRMRLEKYPAAVSTLEKYLKSVGEPISRATGLLELGRAQIGMSDYPAAQKSVDEVLTLQPEGKLSGEGRILAGDIEFARGNAEAAAKLYLSVSLILDDEEVTPRALERAVKAYTKAGKDPEAKKTQNTLQSRYPEYLQKKK